MLPAGQAADPAVRALVNSKSDSVTFSPNRALGVGRLELPMAAKNFALTANKQDGAIGGTAGPLVEFDYADYYINPRIVCSLA